MCCQIDNKGRFLGFVAIRAIVSRQENLQPVYEIDGTHMKHPRYNGVCLTLIGKDGNKGNVLVAADFVPKETEWNFAFFFGKLYCGRSAFGRRGAFHGSRISVRSTTAPCST